MKNIRSILNIKRKNSYMTRNFAIFLLCSLLLFPLKGKKNIKKKHRAEDNFE